MTTPAAEQPAPPRTLFRRYAFAACVAKAIPATRPQASAAARAYLELGAGDPEAYAQVHALADAYLKRPYASQTGADLSLMQCLDFMDSPEVAALTARAIPER